MSTLSTVLFIWIVCAFEVNGQRYGLIYSEITGKPENYSQHCFSYNPQFHELPESIEEAVKHRLVDLLPSVLCEEDDDAGEFTDAVVAVQRGNCTFSEKATIVQDHNGQALLVVSKETNVIPTANSTSDYNRINITVAVIHEQDFNEIKALGANIRVQLYAPMASRADYNLFIIWIMATFTVAAGAYWSGMVKHKQTLRHLRKQQQRDRPSADREEEEEEHDDEQDTLDISPQAVLIFVVLMCGMLLSLYYLFNYLVYLVIGMFTLASAMSMYACLKPLMLRVCRNRASCRFRVPSLPCIGSGGGRGRSGQRGRRSSSGPQYVEVRRLLLAAISVAVAVTWAVLRKEWYAWILQDLLGIMFCINMMKTLRLPSLQVCSILLTLLFVYDIFFVFITPFFTKDGESIMVQVATGGGSGGAAASDEKLPMVLVVPRLHGTPCSMLPYSMLGFGDILVPGLLVSYCYGFDLQVDSGKVYYVATCIGYGVGMVITFIALAFMETGQPALLYLVPCTLIPTILIALKRRELGTIWKGKEHQEQKLKDESGPDDNDCSEPSQVTTAAATATISHRNNSNLSAASAAAAAGGGGGADMDSVSNDSSGSQTLLIN